MKSNFTEWSILALSVMFYQAHNIVVISAMKFCENAGPRRQMVMKHQFFCTSDFYYKKKMPYSMFATRGAFACTTRFFLILWTMALFLQVKYGNSTTLFVGAKASEGWLACVVAFGHVRFYSLVYVLTKPSVSLSHLSISFSSFH